VSGRKPIVGDNMQNGLGSNGHATLDQQHIDESTLVADSQPDDSSATWSWARVLTTLATQQQLAPGQATWAMDQLLTGTATPAQIAAFAVAMKAKRATADEVRELAGAMLRHSIPVLVGRSGADEIVDVVGTGGDGANSVNLSTMAAIVVAASGITVVKHGNRAQSSRSGAADVLEALGVRIDLNADDVARCISELGIAFCFAPLFHPSFRHAATVRRELGIPTVFNLLGPLTNPARPRAGLFGCAFTDMAEVMAGVLAQRGCTALVVHSADGMDELTAGAPNVIWRVHAESVDRVTLDPTTFGFKRSTPDLLAGGGPAANAEVVRSVLAGRSGAVRDAVVLNAAGAIVAHAGVVDGTNWRANWSEHWERAIKQASDAIDSGAASQLLDEWAAYTRSM
jgi:anthranilate phosphoribosyltransferase